MSDTRWYAIGPNPRSRSWSRVLESHLRSPPSVLHGTNFFRCFVSVGWVSGKACGLWKKTEPFIARGSCLKQRKEERLEALGQCIPPPRGRWRNDIIVAMAMPASACHALQRHAAQSVIPLPVSPNSDKSGKQSLYPDGDVDFHQNVRICWLAHCQPSLKISCKSIWKFLCKVANRHTDNDENITSLVEVKNRGRTTNPDSPGKWPMTTDVCSVLEHPL